MTIDKIIINYTFEFDYEDVKKPISLSWFMKDT